MSTQNAANLIENEILAIELRHNKKVKNRYIRRLIRRALTRANLPIPEEYKVQVPGSKKNKRGN